MKRITILVIVLMFSFCSILKDDGIVFTIKNNSKSTITNIVFTTSEKLDSITFKKINSGNKRTAFLSLEKNKIDGEYILKFFNLKNEKIIKKAGYYSNGWTLESSIEFEIKKDTIVVKSKIE